MDLVLIAALLATLWMVAVVAYSAGQRSGREQMRARALRAQQNVARLDAAVERRILRDRAANAQYERLRNVERSAR